MTSSWLKIGLLFFASALSSVCLAQTSNPLKVNVVPPSPDVGALGKYLDMQVGTYTGVPNVSVPIFTIQSYELSLPISLNYNASGLRLNEIASSVGANWSLSAGGVVSRTIKGLPDEAPYGYISTFVGNGGFSPNPFFNGNVINNNYIDLITFPLCGNLERYANIFFASRGGVDLEPDNFFFSLPDGQGGQFLMNRDGNIKMVKKQYASITYNLNLSASRLDSWQATGLDGTRHFFDVTEESTAISYCSVGSDNSPPEAGQPFVSDQINAYSSWKQKKMVSASKNDSILFFYNGGIVTYDLPLSTTLYSSLNPNGTQVDTPDRSSCGSAMSQMSQNLDSIVSANGYKVIFGYHTLRQDLNGGKALDSIKVLFRNKLVKGFKLHFAFEGGATTDSKRMVLKSVTEFGSKGGTMPPYSFDYFSFPAESIASSNTDHWGYYNAANNSIETPTLIYNNRLYLGANKEANLEAAKAGSLRSLKYPTGGVVRFEYELNSFSNLRDMEVRSFSPRLTQLASTTFTITSNINAVYQDVQYFSLNQTTSIAFAATLPGTDGIGPSKYTRISTLAGQVIRDYIASGNPNPELFSLPAGSYKLESFFQPSAFNWSQTPLANQQFSVVVQAVNRISEQTEVQGGGLRIKRISYEGIQGMADRVFKYTKRGSNVTSGKLMLAPRYIASKTFNYDVWDQPSVSCIFYRSDSVLIRSTSSLNPPFSTSGSPVGYDRVVEYTVRNGYEGNNLRSNSNGFTVYSYTNQPSTNINYSMVDPVIPPLNYTYKNGLLITKEVFTRDSVRISKSVNTYQYDQTENIGYALKIAESVSTQCFGCANRRFTMSNYHTLSERVRLASTREVSYTGLDSMWSEQFFFYNNFDQIVKKETTLSRTGERIEEEIAYHPLIPALPTQTTVTKVNTGNRRSSVSGQKTDYNASFKPTIVYLRDSINVFEPRLEYLSYNTKGKPLAHKLTGDSLRTAYVWDATGNFPIAEVVNADHTQVFYTSFEDVLGSTGSSKTGLKSFSGSTFNVPVILPAFQYGYRCSYWYFDGTWKFSGILPYDRNNNTITHPGATRLDEIRIMPVRARMKTFAYTDIGQVHSVMDENGDVNYFQYDEFGRLIIITDEQGNILKSYKYNFFKE